MFKTIKETIKVAKGAYNISKVGGYQQYIKNLQIKYDEMDKDGFIIRTDDNMVYGSGFTGAATTLLNFGLGINVPTIFITSDMEKYDNDVKEFIIYHEKGHYIMGNIGMSNERILEYEIEADMHAALMMGKERCLKAMEKFNETLTSTSQKEMVKRMEAIKNSYL